MAHRSQQDDTSDRRYPDVPRHTALRGLFFLHRSFQQRAPGSWLRRHTPHILSYRLHHCGRGNSSFAALASLALHRLSPFSVHNDSLRKVHTKRAEIRNYLTSNELWLRDCAFSRTGAVEISTNAEISAAKIETLGSVIRVAVLLRLTRKLPRDGNQHCHSCLAWGDGTASFPVHSQLFGPRKRLKASRPART